MVTPPSEVSLPHSDAEGVCTIRQFTAGGLLEELQEALELLKQVAISPVFSHGINLSTHFQIRPEHMKCV